jgi:hypothetical protein
LIGFPVPGRADITSDTLTGVYEAARTPGAAVPGLYFGHRDAVGGHEPVGIITRVRAEYCPADGGDGLTCGLIGDLLLTAEAAAAVRSGRVRELSPELNNARGVWTLGGAALVPEGRDDEPNSNPDNPDADGGRPDDETIVRQYAARNRAGLLKYGLTGDELMKGFRGFKARHARRFAELPSGFTAAEFLGMD